MTRLRSLSPIIAAIIIIAVVIAISAAVISYLFSTVSSIQQGSVGGLKLLCKLTPLKTSIYVRPDGCGIGFMILITPSDQPCSELTIDSIEIIGVGKAEYFYPGKARINVPGEAYIVLFPSRGKLYFVTYPNEDSALAVVKYYLSRGKCIPGFDPTIGYPGAVIWDGRVTYFTWHVEQLPP